VEAIQPEDQGEKDINERDSNGEERPVPLVEEQEKPAEAGSGEEIAMENCGGEAQESHIHPQPPTEKEKGGGKEEEEEEITGIDEEEEDDIDDEEEDDIDDEEENEQMAEDEFAEQGNVASLPKEHQQLLSGLQLFLDPFTLEVVGFSSFSSLSGLSPNASWFQAPYLDSYRQDLARCKVQLFERHRPEDSAETHSITLMQECIKTLLQCGLSAWNNTRKLVGCPCFLHFLHFNSTSLPPEISLDMKFHFPLFFFLLNPFFSFPTLLLIIFLEKQREGKPTCLLPELKRPRFLVAEPNQPFMNVFFFSLNKLQRDERVPHYAATWLRCK